MEKYLLEHIKKAVEHALKGGMVVCMETYFKRMAGACPVCPIFSKKGIEFMYELKKRPKNIPFNTLVNSIGMANCIGEVNDFARDILERYGTQPVSVIIKNRCTPSYVNAGGDTVSVHIAEHETVRKLIDSLGPLAFTSPNIHGEPYQKNADLEVARKLFGHEDRIYYIPEELGDLKLVGLKSLPSTIVDTTAKPPKISRQGYINVVEVEK